MSVFVIEVCFYFKVRGVNVELFKFVKTSGFVQQGGDSASLVTTYAALRPRDGFPHPHQEQMKDTYILYSLSYFKLSI